MGEWLRNIFVAAKTVADGLYRTLALWFATYARDRKTFTDAYVYPEKPAEVAIRYRGFHRFDLSTCIGCDQCARACPVDCIYIDKQKGVQGKGFAVTSFAIDYSKCMFCALCVEPCPVDCIFMGSTLDISSYSRDGAIVDFAKLPVEAAWGQATLNPTLIDRSKAVTRPAHPGPYGLPPATATAAPADKGGNPPSPSA
ncbi:MAG TPA: 4Fe-4S binding protein [Pirellulaceae bacterium]|jgi:NADH-quinone oxidoreductase subunit I|nr:4Fe-4S binding protein [Pirellulaceae bacterium]